MPRLSPAARRWLLRALQLGIAALVLWRAGADLSGQWAAVRARGGALRPAWPLVAASCALVLATHALLVHAWRRLVGAWGVPLAFWPAARIWSVSNLGRYVPGKVWGVAMMAVMARRAGISPVAATGSAILSTLVNLAAGFAVLLLAGSRGVAVFAPGAERLAVGIAGAAALGLVALPVVLPAAARLAARLLQRELTLPAVARGRLALVAASNAAAWLGYGFAFRLLAAACLPAAALGSGAGGWLAYAAVFTGSYLAGYLALVVPGGLGVRELAMVSGLVGLGLAGSVDAWLLAVASRLWLTLLEIVPGLAFAARDAALRPAAPRPPPAPDPALPDRGV